MAKAVGKVGKKAPKGFNLRWVDRKGHAKAGVRIRGKAKKTVALGGDVVKKKKGHLYFIKGGKIMEAKMNRKGRKGGRKMKRHRRGR